MEVTELTNSLFLFSLPYVTLAFAMIKEANNRMRPLVVTNHYVYNISPVTGNICTNVVYPN